MANFKSASCFAPAKINLVLHVTGQRNDGYHLLESMVAFASVGDKVNVQINEALGIGEHKLLITGAFSNQLDPGDNNLILRAVKRFEQAFACFPSGLELSLEKNLPIASGIGGGSADAAATLLALAKIAKIDNFEKLQKIGLTLGADIPMCLHSCGLIAKGIGDQIQLIENLPEMHLLLVNPQIEVSTPLVFETLTSKSNDALAPLSGVGNFRDYIEWLSEQRNDLETPAITTQPVIKTVLKLINDSGAKLARMSGSGATCFGIFNDENSCAHAGLQIANAKPSWWVKPTKILNFGVKRVL